MLGIDPRAARYTWTAVLILFVIWVAYMIREALFIFILALLLAYLLYPLMDLIDRRLTAKTRTPALAMTFILVIGVIVAVAIPTGSVVAAQAANLAREAPNFIERVRQNPPAAPNNNGVKSIEQQIIGMAEGQLQAHYGDLASIVPKVGVKVLSASQNLIYLVIVPILSFLILRDGRRIRDGFLEVFEADERDGARETLADIHELLLLYMRALLFLCGATLVSFSIVLSIMGVPYALLLATFAFPLEFIPLVGPLVAAVTIIVVSIVSGYAHVWWVVIFLGIYRMFQDYVLSPMLMSKGVEIHPALVIFGVLAGGELAGVPGIFLSVPMIALLRLLYHRLNAMRLKRRFRRSPEPVAEPV